MGMINSLKKLPIFAVLFLIVFLGISWGVYKVFGSKIIEDIYNQESLEFLNNILSGRHIHSLDDYLNAGDRIMAEKTIDVIVAFFFSQHSFSSHSRNTMFICLFSIPF